MLSYGDYQVLLVQEGVLNFHHLSGYVNYLRNILLPSRHCVFRRSFASLDLYPGAVAFASVIVGVEDDDGVASLLRLLDVRQLGPVVDAVVDDETSGRQFLKCRKAKK